MPFCTRPKVRVTRLKGTGRGLAPGAGQLVVEFRVLEVGQLQGQRLFQDHHVDALPHQRPQQRLAGRRCRAGAGDQRHHPCLGGDEQQHVAGVGAAGLLVLRHRRDHAVDDQLADPGHRRRQHPGDQGQQGEDQRQPPAGRPDQLQGAAAVAEHVEKVLGRRVAVAGQGRVFHGRSCRKMVWSEGGNHSISGGKRKGAGVGARCGTPPGNACRSDQKVQTKGMTKTVTAMKRRLRGMPTLRKSWKR